jgi:hypothetical protein
MFFMKKALWFKAKRYGYGWYPATWQGWAVLALALASITINSIMIDRRSHSVSDTLIGSVGFTILVVALLIIVCVLTGEKPKWRWGKE